VKPVVFGDHIRDRQRHTIGGDRKHPAALTAAGDVPFPEHRFRKMQPQLISAGLQRYAVPEVAFAMGQVDLVVDGTKDPPRRARQYGTALEPNIGRPQVPIAVRELPFRVPGQDADRRLHPGRSRDRRCCRSQRLGCRVRTPQNQQRKQCRHEGGPERQQHPS
jgi:hypothetical protein